MEKLIKAIETLEEQIEALVEDSQTSVDIDESQLTDLSANLATLKRARHIPVSYTHLTLPTKA